MLRSWRVITYSRSRDTPTNTLPHSQHVHSLPTQLYWVYALILRDW